MSWFVIHVIEFTRFKDEPPEFFIINENILLIEALDQNEAETKANRFSVDGFTNPDKGFNAPPTLIIELKDGTSKPATMVYQGIKKCEEIDHLDFNQAFQKMTEVQMLFKSEEDFDTFLQDEEVEFFYLG